MTKDLELAKSILIEKDYTCVIVKNEEIILTSYERGAKPILKAVDEHGDNLVDAVIADKVIGKAAAFLAARGGIKEIYTHVLSERGKEVLEEYGITYHYKRLVPSVLNRNKSDLCPLEKLTSNMSSPEQALLAIKNFYIELDKKR